jgi:hypothetical protein
MEPMKSALLMLAIAACSIQHRSDEYVCTKQSDCNGNRTCISGFCVLDGTVDAPKSDATGKSDSGNGCPAGCTSCNLGQHTCTIDCRTTSCTGLVTCPSGYNCDVLCDTDNSCRNGINCSAALSCNIACSATNSCHNVECGLGGCAVNCSGSSSCSTVACNNSCACDVTCTGSASCGAVQCTSLACKAGLGCSSVTNVCHSCP